MEVSVPVFAVGSPTQDQGEIVVADEKSYLAPLVAFLQDHFVKGGYEGGKIAYDLLQTIQQSSDSSKQEFVRNLPSIARRLTNLPNATRALFSDDPTAVAIIERQLGALSGDVASATSTGVLFGLSRLVNTALPFTVAAGALVGAAIGGERIQLFVQSTRATIKED